MRDEEGLRAPELPVGAFPPSASAVPDHIPNTLNPASTGPIMVFMGLTGFVCANCRVVRREELERRLLAVIQEGDPVPRKCRLSSSQSKGCSGSG